MTTEAELKAMQKTISDKAGNAKPTDSFVANMGKADKVKKAPKRHLEDDLQEVVIRYLRAFYPKVIAYAIPNGGTRNKKEAGRLKKQGVLKGVPDIFVSQPKTEHGKITHGLYLELKIKPNKPSVEQKELMVELEVVGYQTEVIYSFDMAKTIIDTYLK